MRECLGVTECINVTISAPGIIATTIQDDAEDRTKELSVIDCWNGLDAEVVLLRFLALAPSISSSTVAGSCPSVMNTLEDPS